MEARGRVRDREIEERGTPAYVAEFLGTFLLVLFVCSVVTVNSEGGLGFTDFAVIGLVHVFVLALLVYSLGHTSGAHFNPAVTAALTALRKITPLDALIYVLVQLAGAVAAALVTKVLMSDEGDAVNYGATTVSEKFLQGKALGGLLVEIIGTFVLMWAIMTFAVNQRGLRDWAGLGIGMALGLGVMVFAPLDGAGFNPARSFGPAIVSGEFSDFWVYVIGPVIGALLAAFAYVYLVLEPEDRVARAPIDTLPG
ncbi:MAG: aquaporin [Solirubrobacteraceae bacterium]|nr:aquaporin [Solirubrobacteraceae bacterium]